MLFRLPGHLLSLIALHCGNGGGWKRFSSICYWPASGRERACHQPRRRRPPRQFPSGSERLARVEHLRVEQVVVC